MKEFFALCLALVTLVLKWFEKPSGLEAETQEKAKTAAEREEALKSSRPDADFWKRRGL